MIRIIIFLWQHYAVAGVLSFHCLAISIDVQYVANNVFLLRFIHWLWILWRENIASNYTWPFICCIIYSCAHSLFCSESDCVFPLVMQQVWWSICCVFRDLRLQSVMSCWLTHCCSMHWKAFVWIEYNMYWYKDQEQFLSLVASITVSKHTKKEHLVLLPVMQKGKKNCPWKRWRTVCECTF